MAESFFLMKGDRLPKIQATLLDANQAAINLTGASVVFRMRAVGSTGAPKVSAAAVILSAVAGTVEYSWAAADVDTVGAFDAQWVVTYSGLNQTVPNDSTIRVIISSTLEAA